MKYDISGAHVLNKFVWSELSKPESQGGLGMSISDYSGLVPIIPTQQVPVFNEMGAGKPFIVYTYTSVGYSTNIWDNVEQMNYMVYSDDEVKLRRVLHFITDILHRYDKTAEEVNDYITAASVPRVDSDDVKFEFKYVTVISSRGPEPAVTEGGRQAASVTMRYSYIYDENERSRRG